MTPDVYLDTNILLDVLVKREPHYSAAARVWTLCEKGAIRGHISVISFNNIFYLVRKERDRRVALKVMTLLKDIFRPVTLDEALLGEAMEAGFADFEDAIQYFSAVRCGASCLVTRNGQHFVKSAVPVMTCERFLAEYVTK
jgi:predicted nucleic acid-binding protein